MPKRKYSFEQRLEVVMYYFASADGYRLISERFNIPRTQVRMWVAAYRAYGEEGIKPKPKGVSVDPDIRVSAVKAALEGHMSYNQVALHYKLASAGVIAKWINVYKQYGEDGLRSLRVGKNREIHMAIDPLEAVAAQERTKDKRIKALEDKVRVLEIRVHYLKKLKALVR